MSLRCEVCGKKVENLRRMGGWRFNPRVYCSKDCFYIGDIDVHIFMTFSMILFPPFLPLFLYYWIKGEKLRKQRRIELESRKKLCFYCSNEIVDLKEGKNICMSCGNSIHFCDLCQKHIFANEEILQVEPCGHIFHRSEFLDWSEKKSICPKCGEKVELVDYEPE